MKSFVFLLAFSFLLSGCDVLDGQNSVTLGQLDAQLKDIQEFVNKASCSPAGECDYLPIGSKACGGPMGFIIFSNDIDVEALRKKIDKYTNDQKTYNRENNVISDCSLPNPPEKLGCVDGDCVEIR